MKTTQIIVGDALASLKAMQTESVQCCVTSPPYFGLRDYGADGQIGLESTPEEYVARIVEVFREVRRVLKNDGTLWINLGDSFARSGGAAGGGNALLHMDGISKRMTSIPQGSRLKEKDLIGIPWMVAFALRSDSWYLRSDIIWSKPNAMPESVTDRPTKAHEYLFLLSKSERYFYDHEAIKERAVSDHSSGNGFKRDARLSFQGSDGSPRGNDQPWGAEKSGKGGKNAFQGQGHFRETEAGPANRDGRDMQNVGASDYRNKRSVWEVATKPFPDAHFATFPLELIRPCIQAGSRVGDLVIDPFSGAGTTGVVCIQEGRQYIGLEIKPEYASMSERRLLNTQPPMIFGEAA